MGTLSLRTGIPVCRLNFLTFYAGRHILVCPGRVFCGLFWNNILIAKTYYTFCISFFVILEKKNRLSIILLRIGNMARHWITNQNKNKILTSVEKNQNAAPKTDTNCDMACIQGVTSIKNLGPDSTAGCISGCVWMMLIKPWKSRLNSTISCILVKFRIMMLY